MRPSVPDDLPPNRNKQRTTMKSRLGTEDAARVRAASAEAKRRARERRQAEQAPQDGSAAIDGAGGDDRQLVMEDEAAEAPSTIKDITPPEHLDRGQPTEPDPTTPDRSQANAPDELDTEHGLPAWALEQAPRKKGASELGSTLSSPQDRPEPEPAVEPSEAAPAETSDDRPLKTTLTSPIDADATRRLREAAEAAQLEIRVEEAPSSESPAPEPAPSDDAAAAAEPKPEAPSSEPREASELPATVDDAPAQEAPARPSEPPTERLADAPQSLDWSLTLRVFAALVLAAVVVLLLIRLLR